MTAKELVFTFNNVDFIAYLREDGTKWFHADVLKASNTLEPIAHLVQHGVVDTLSVGVQGTEPVLNVAGVFDATTKNRWFRMFFMQEVLPKVYGTVDVSSKVDTVKVSPAILHDFAMSGCGCPKKEHAPSCVHYGKVARNTDKPVPKIEVLGDSFPKYTPAHKATDLVPKVVVNPPTLISRDRSLFRVSDCARMFGMTNKEFVAFLIKNDYARRDTSTERSNHAGQLVPSARALKIKPAVVVFEPSSYNHPKTGDRVSKAQLMITLNGFNHLKAEVTKQSCSLPFSQA